MTNSTNATLADKEEIPNVIKIGTYAVPCMNENNDSEMSEREDNGSCEEENVKSVADDKQNKEGVLESSIPEQPGESINKND